jgi:hypothetical protein
VDLIGLLGAHLTSGDALVRRRSTNLLATLLEGDAAGAAGGGGAGGGAPMEGARRCIPPAGSPAMSVA